jgi:hypothetical protein
MLVPLLEKRRHGLLLSRGIRGRRAIRFEANRQGAL